MSAVMTLDMLPAKCTIEIDGFLLGRVLEERSEWSGWFRYEGEPIVLQWDTFWAPQPSPGAPPEAGAHSPNPEPPR